MREITYLNLSDLSLDGATQQRARMSFTHVQSLEDALSDETSELEPIEVICEGERYWVVDGFHRILAYRHKGRNVIPVYVTNGTQRDAILKSVSANAENLALPRTRADKHKAVKTLLNDPEWSQLSDREIAKWARVDHKTVAATRKILVGNSPDTKVNIPERKVTRGGTTYQMRISGGGGGASTKPEDGYYDDYGDYVDYGSTQQANINEWTARDGHLVPKSALGGTEIQLKELPRSPEPLPEKKVIPIDLKEIFIGFMSNYDKFPPTYRLAVKQRIAEVDELTAITTLAK